MWWSQRGCRWQYGGALHAGSVRLHARKHTPARVDPHTLTHCLPTEMCNICFFSTATMVSCMRLSFTLYVHCLSCYIFQGCLSTPELSVRFCNIHHITLNSSAYVKLSLTVQYVVICICILQHLFFFFSSTSNCTNFSIFPFTLYFT